MVLGVGFFFFLFLHQVLPSRGEQLLGRWRFMQQYLQEEGTMSAFNFLASMIKRHLLSGFFIGHAGELSREHVWERTCLFARAVITTAILIYD